jgi:hypothetical protein
MVYFWAVTFPFLSLVSFLLIITIIEISDKNNIWKYTKNGMRRRYINISTSKMGLYKLNKHKTSVRSF